MSSKHFLPAVWLVITIVFVAMSGCLEPRERIDTRGTNNCTTCHGSATREVDGLAQAAPPFDVAGNDDPAAPGNGAHTIHLTPNEVHGGVACAACHVVPAETLSAGHVDSALPAEVTFSGAATLLGRAPVYDAELQSCADTYCHLEASPRWVPMATPSDRCASCHGSPPPPPHPASDACHLCHGEVVDESGAIINLAKHIDGVVDVDESCNTCHGTGTDGAPPPDLNGSIDAKSRGVGAHTAHLASSGLGAPVSCATCHLVPDTAGADGHLDGDGVAELRFAEVAVAHDRAPDYEHITQTCTDSWCHGATSPRWTDPTQLTCDGCHGFPPASPHPQMAACAQCHAPIVDTSGAIVVAARHVDGIVDVALPTQCNGCHGDDDSPAPPRDLAGNIDESFRGVGAHRIHVEGTNTSRAVPCGECHSVPASILDPGHVDTFAPAELRFSGVARAFGGSPSFNGTTCSDSYCHGDRFVLGHDSGGTTTTPTWTLTDGSQSQCTSCHGLPPPPPHPAGPLFCSDCHPNIGFPLTILDPNSHVNGVVDL